MEGVEILATINTFGGDLLNGLIVVGVISLFVGLLIGLVEDSFATGFAATMALLVMGGMGTTVIVSVASTDNSPTYKVTISDEVNLKEFLDKYEIISREDEIFLIREIGERNG